MPYGASLDMILVRKPRGPTGMAPVATPHQSVGARQVTEKAKVALPTRLAIDQVNDVAGQAVMMNSNMTKLGSALLKKTLLPLFAPVGLINPEHHAVRGRVLENRFNLAPGSRFQKLRVRDPVRGAIMRTDANNVGIEVSQDVLLKKAIDDGVPPRNPGFPEGETKDEGERSAFRPPNYKAGGSGFCEVKEVD